MAEPINATNLRSNLYRVLDHVLATGEPQEIVRGSRRLLLVPVGSKRLDLDRLPKRDLLACTPEELVATSWEQEWQPDP